MIKSFLSSSLVFSSSVSQICIVSRSLALLFLVLFKLRVIHLGSSGLKVLCLVSSPAFKLNQ